MDHLFQSLFGRGDVVDANGEFTEVDPAVFFQQQQQQQEPRGAPPASRNAIRQLPTVTVAPEDLVEESNRECCICLEPNNLKDRVTRLPCAHIFHPNCIMEWLQKHCTCPVCRYELATDDLEYEAGRLERMKHRKPRFAMYELERMSPRELRTWAAKLGLVTMISGGLVEKHDLIQHIVDSDKIDLIAAPRPVEYPLSLLTAMGVSDLKRTMSNAGVFFDPIDVVEKQDMIRIFVNSGRLLLLPEEEDAAGTDTNVVVMDEDCRKPAAKKRKQTPEPMVETVTESDDENEIGNNKGSRSSSSGQWSSTSVMEFNEDFVEPDLTEQQSQNVAIEGEDRGSQEGETRTDNLANEATQERTIDAEEVPSTSPHDDSGESRSVEAAAAPYQDQSVAQLREMARELRIDISDCIERSEMVERLASASLPVAVEDLASWSATSLQKTAQSLGVDVTGMDRTAMIGRLVQQAETDPRVAHRLGNLAPLVEKSVSELRSVARQWHVDVSDCLEKREMIDRLVMTGGPP